jgi:hypothetical protein
MNDVNSPSCQNQHKKVVAEISNEYASMVAQPDEWLASA